MELAEELQGLAAANALVHAVIVGYSRLMAEDEQATIRTRAKGGSSNRRKPAREQWFRWPGVFPRSVQYAPRAIFRIRQTGSQGTENRQGPLLTRRISRTAASVDCFGFVSLGRSSGTAAPSRAS